MKRTWVISKRLLTISDYEVDDDSLLVMPVTDAEQAIENADTKGYDRGFLQGREKGYEEGAEQERERILEKANEIRPAPGPENLESVSPILYAMERVSEIFDKAIKEVRVRK